MSTDLERRDLFKIAAGAAVATQLGFAQEGPRFFTADQLSVVDELAEIIIPTDDHSPGARAAGVVSYIDARLGESLDQEKRDSWRHGVQLVNRLSVTMNGQPFLKASPEQRTAVVERLAQNERDPKSPEELFFRELKRATVQAYYTSKIGIHQEMEYKGNVLLNTFVGTELP
jgi:glucoside 3-dehydrogenase (cytochrome c) hitch-hiker subunit